MTDVSPTPGPCVGLCDSSKNCDSSPDVCGKYLRMKLAAVLAPDLAEAVEQIEDQLFQMHHFDRGSLAACEEALRTLIRHVRSGGLTEGQVEVVLDAERMAKSMAASELNEYGETLAESSTILELVKIIRAAFPAVFGQGGGE